MHVLMTIIFVSLALLEQLTFALGGIFDHILTYGIGTPYFG